MGGARRGLVLLGVLALAGVVTLGTTGVGPRFAVAQQPGDTPAQATGLDAELLERLDDLERVLPDGILPPGFSFGVPVVTANVGGQSLALRRQLDGLEPELRALYSDADDARTDVGDAVAAVTRGWLDAWQAAKVFDDVEAHDLAFPVGTRDVDGVATGSDDLRTLIEVGIRIALDANEHHLDGYVQLRTLGRAGPAAQERLDRRAAAAEAFDAQVRPELHRLLSERTTSYILAIARFETTNPGVLPRATAVEVVCVDRELAAEAGRALTMELAQEIARRTPTRDDCPDLPEGEVAGEEDVNGEDADPEAGDDEDDAAEDATP